MKWQKWDPDYTDIVRKGGEGILLLDRPVEHQCKCGAVFLGTRNAVWCEVCRPLALARNAVRSMLKQRKKRAEARAAKRGAA